MRILLALPQTKCFLVKSPGPDWVGEVSKVASFLAIQDVIESEQFHQKRTNNVPEW